MPAVRPVRVRFVDGEVLRDATKAAADAVYGHCRGSGVHVVLVFDCVVNVLHELGCDSFGDGIAACIRLVSEVDIKKAIVNVDLCYVGGRGIFRDGIRVVGCAGICVHPFAGGAVSPGVRHLPFRACAYRELLKRGALAEGIAIAIASLEIAYVRRIERRKVD